MKKLSLLLIFISSLSAFSFDGMIDSISNKVADSVGNKITKSIDDLGNDDSDSEQHKQSTDKNTKLAKLKELVSMRENGYITKSEYLEARKKLLSQ